MWSGSDLKLGSLRFYVVTLKNVCKLFVVPVRNSASSKIPVQLVCMACVILGGEKSVV